MNQNNKALSALILFGVLTFSGCTLPQMIKKAKDQKLTTVPDPLEVHGNKVNFDMTALLPVKMLKKKTTYTGAVGYKYGDQKVDVGSIEFKAENFPNAKKEQPKIDKSFSFDYKDGMEQRGNLILVGTAAKGSKSKVTPEYPFTRGLITTSRLVKDIYLVSYGDHGYNNQPEFVPVNVNFYFSQGNADLRASETSSKRGKFLDAFIAHKNVTKTVTITGSHSPEGTETKNTKLAGHRSASIEKFYKGQMKRFDYKAKSDSIEFVQKAIVLDWTMLKDSLATYKDLTQEQKDQVLGIVDGGDSFYDKAAKISKLPFYGKLFTHVYPKLRAAQTEILTLKEKKPDAEIAVLGKKIAEGKDSLGALNEQELLYSASLTPDLKEKQAIYEAAVKKSDSWQAHNNVAAIQLDMARKATDKAQMATMVDAAISHLQMANNKKETAEAYSNLAVAYTMKGLAKEASEALTKAAGLNGGQDVARSIKAQQGIASIRSGNYAEAINSLSAAGQDATVLYNKGLAQVLSKQYDAALATLNESATADATQGWTYYVAAIAAARAKNESALTTNLQKATQADASLKAKALTDLEFDSYLNSEAFKNSIK